MRVSNNINIQTSNSLTRSLTYGLRVVSLWFSLYQSVALQVHNSVKKLNKQTMENNNNNREQEDPDGPEDPS
jgi:hypothetical protein